LHDLDARGHELGLQGFELGVQRLAIGGHSRDASQSSPRRQTALAWIIGSYVSAAGGDTASWFRAGWETDPPTFRAALPHAIASRVGAWLAGRSWKIIISPGPVPRHCPSSMGPLAVYFLASIHVEHIRG
jgi:hypothetical protein